MPHLDDPLIVSSLIQSTDTVHRWGAMASIELTHSGNRSKPEFLTPGGFILGPSELWRLTFTARRCAKWMSL